MVRRACLLAALVLATAAFAAVAGRRAEAQSVRTFVSGQGVDSGTCALTAPCRSFAYALTQTASGGEIVVLNSAGYGSVNIMQSVSIVNPGGVEAGISTASGATAITVAAGASDSVNLRGLTIEGNGIAQDGIVMTGSGKLDVLDCDVRDMSHDGIVITPNNVPASVVVADTTVANNHFAGIDAEGDSAGTGLLLNLTRVNLINNGPGGIANGGYGIRLAGVTGGYLQATIDASLIFGSGYGLAMQLAVNPNLVVAIFTNSRIVSNATSLSIGEGNAVHLEKTTVAGWGTGTGFSDGGITNAGTIYSYGDNVILDTVSGNAITTVPLK